MEHGKVPSLAAEGRLCMRGMRYAYESTAIHMGRQERVGTTKLHGANPRESGSLSPTPARRCTHRPPQAFPPPVPTACSSNFSNRLTAVRGRRLPRNLGPPRLLQTATHTSFGGDKLVRRQCARLQRGRPRSKWQAKMRKEARTDRQAQMPVGGGLCPPHRRK